MNRGEQGPKVVDVDMGVAVVVLVAGVIAIH